MGAGLIAWTARGAVACWLARWILRPVRRHGGPSRAEVVLSAAGWLLLVAHTACAFHFRHGWSHAAAYAHTAQRTAETVGWNWGGGLYANYATIAVWGAGVLGVSRDYVRRRPQPRWWIWMETGWIGFMMFNATVVFGPRTWWLPAAAVVVGLATVRSCRRRRRSETSTG